jgi:hypothetical protein
MYWWAFSPLPKRKVDKKKYPQTCKCGADAYEGAYAYECTNPSCRHYVQPKESDYLPADTTPTEDFADEDTKPGLDRTG